MGASMKKHKPLLHLNIISRAEDSLLSSPPLPPSISVVNASPSPASSPKYYRPIFISPPPFQSPPPPSPPSHSSLPTAAIVGGSVAGAIVTLAITATIISAVASKAGVSSCILALLRLLPSLAGGPFAKPCAKFNALICSDRWSWNRLKGQGSDHKTGDAYASGRLSDQDINLLGGGGRSPDVIIAKAQTAAATAYSLAKSPGPSVQSILTTYASEIVDGELEKQKALIMQPLHQNVMKAQEYFESLCSCTSNAASDELKALKSSAQAYLDEVGKLKASAEHLSTADIALLLEEAAIQAGAKTIKNSSIGVEYAAEVKRLQQKLRNETLEEVVLNSVLAKSPLRSGGEACHHVEEVSTQYMQRNGAVVCPGGLVPIVETFSDASQLQEEMGAIVLNQSSADQQHMSSVPSAGNEGAIQPTAGPIVPVPTKAITPIPTRTMTSAAAKKPAWQLGQPGKKRKRPTNLGHASFSCDISAYRLHFFTSCRSGGSYGSPPPPSQSEDDMKFHNNNNYVGMHDLDLENNYKHFKESNYYNNNSACHSISYGGNSHMGLLTSSSAPIKHHYNVNVQNQQAITDPISPHQMPPPCKLNNGSKAHASLDYGDPFDGVL
ncbi:hypothetical protein L7F22_062504 [Adiantum nelumboides]|nr:hypothetical protein [Adiantum nelumboides]